MNQYQKISHPSEKYYICKRLHIHRQLTAKQEKKIDSAGSRAFRKQYPGERATKLTEPDISLLTKEACQLCVKYK